LLTAGRGDAVRFADEVEWRVSRRGLVIAVPGGDTVLLDHPHTADLPVLLADDPSADELAERLGSPNAEPLVADMAEAGILGTAASPARRHQTPPFEIAPGGDHHVAHPSPPVP
jgi:hypothetical protein